MPVPAFSAFTAASELFVTAGVLYIIRRNWTRRRFALWLFLAVALFEAFVNVMYMASRASQVAGSSGPPLAAGMKLAYASHGLLSLLAYLVFVMFGVFAWQEQKNGRFLFRDRPALTFAFLVVWVVSVLSGEGIFVARYLL